MSRRSRQPTLNVFLATGATNNTTATATPSPVHALRNATVGLPTASLVSATSPAYSHRATAHDVTLIDDGDVRVEEAEESGASMVGADAAVVEFAGAASDNTSNESTLVNDVDISVDAAGDVDGTPAGRESLAWSCSVCTFLNLNAEAPVCEVCCSPRNPVKTGRLDDGVNGASAVAVDDSIRMRNRDDSEDDTDTLSTTEIRAGSAVAVPSLDSGHPPGSSEGVSNRKRPRLIGAFGGSLLPRVNTSGSSLGGSAGRLEPTPNPAVDGLYIIHDFIDEATEAALVEWVDKGDAAHPWRRSRFNGKYMVKTWGVRTDLGTGTVRLPTGDEPVFPPKGGQMDVVIDNLRRIDFGRLARKAQGWFPNEANANLYDRGEGHYLGAHFDHRGVSGPFLATLSLEGDACMTFRREDTGHAVRVELPRRSIQLVCRTARYSYTHEIAHADMHSPRRISITFRMAKLS